MAKHQCDVLTKRWLPFFVAFFLDRLNALVPPTGELIYTLGFDGYAAFQEVHDAWLAQFVTVATRKTTHAVPSIFFAKHKEHVDVSVFIRNESIKSNLYFKHSY